jgi:hypothetical protein
MGKSENGPLRLEFQGWLVETGSAIECHADELQRDFRGLRDVSGIGMSCVAGLTRRQAARREYPLLADKSPP